MRSTLLALTFFAITSLQAQHASWRMPLTGSLDLPRIANDATIPFGDNYSSIWGYTDSVTGREYAILGCWNGTSIIDITDSAVEVGWIPGLPSLWREMKTYSHYAYVCTEAKNPADTGIRQGIEVIDLQNPADPKLIFAFDSTLSSTHTVSLDGHFLYCNGSNHKLRILDLTNPRHPVDVGADTSIQMPYVHDAIVRNDTMYAAHVYNHEGVGIYDMKDKQQPATIGAFTYPKAGTHNCWLTDDSKYLITTDEIEAEHLDCKIWDLHDIASPHMITEFAFSDTEVAHNVFIEGRLAYVAHYSAGITVWDISDISVPVLVGYYDTYPPVINGRNYGGAWGTYPFFASGKIITSDRSTGLYVNTLQRSPIGRLRVHVIDSASGAPIPLAPVQLISANTLNISTQGHGRTDLSGTVGVGIADTGRAFLRVARDTLATTITLVVSLTEDVTKDVTVRIGTTATLSPVRGSSAPHEFAVVSTYPNPANTLVALRYHSSTDLGATVRIYSMDGGLIRTEQRGFRSGESSMSLDTHTIPNGPYLCGITAAGKTSVVPFVVNR